MPPDLDSYQPRPLSAIPLKPSTRKHPPAADLDPAAAAAGLPGGGTAAPVGVVGRPGQLHPAAAAAAAMAALAACGERRGCRAAPAAVAGRRPLPRRLAALGPGPGLDLRGPRAAPTPGLCGRMCGP